VSGALQAVPPQLVLTNPPQAFAYRTEYIRDANGSVAERRVQSPDGVPYYDTYIERTYKYDILRHVVSEMGVGDAG
jgi:hypothetical protein